MRTIDELRKIFSADRFITGIGIHIDSVGDNSAIVSVNLEDRHLNGLDMPQGGFLYTLADVAMGAAANLQNGEAVTLSANISYLKSPRGSKIFAEATPVKLGRATRVYNVRVFDENGVDCCVGIFTAFVTKPEGSTGV